MQPFGAICKADANQQRSFAQFKSKLRELVSYNVIPGDYEDDDDNDKKGDECDPSAVSVDSLQDPYIVICCDLLLSLSPLRSHPPGGQDTDFAKGVRSMIGSRCV
jgi:hypothetical protein